MKLRSARIQNLRSIEDSGDFTLEDVTCLVGKNEAGKTTVLRGLHKLNPDNPNDARFDPLDDYPRRRFAAYRAHMEESPDPILSTHWELEPKDLEVIEKCLGPAALKGRSITISKGYNNQLKIDTATDEAALVTHLVGEANLGPEDAAKLEGVATLDGLRSRLSPTTSLSAPLQELQANVVRVSPEWSMEKAIALCLTPLIPRFLYFADYEKMSGQVALDDFLAKKAAKQLSGGQRIFGALLELAGTSAEDLKKVGRFEALKAELEAVSSKITEEVFSYWTQNQRLSVEFDFRPGMPGDPPPYNSGMVFRTRVKNELHQVTVNFDERSSGFIWFFSFLVWFSQLKATYGDKIVILLDEPGLSLHGRAQEDLLRFINERLRPSYQVVYTTHSPFMVDPENLLAVRTVEDKSTDADIVGTVISDQVLSSDRDTIFPLQAAIGYDIAQSLFVGKDTILVEGPSDLLYLKWASSELQKAGKAPLDRRWVICPTGGIDKFWSFVALFGGNKLNLAVVSDFHHGDKSKLRALRESQIIPSERVLTAEVYANQSEADVEDLLGKEFYCALIDRTYTLTGPDSVSSPKVWSADERIVKAVENHLSKDEGQPTASVVFDHFRPAEWLVENAAEARKFTGYVAALTRFERLFHDLNSMITPVSKRDGPPPHPPSPNSSGSSRPRLP